MWSDDTGDANGESVSYSEGVLDKVIREFPHRHPDVLTYTSGWQRIILTLTLSLNTLPSRRPPPKFFLTPYPSSRTLATNWLLSVNASALMNLLTSLSVALERGIALGSAKVDPSLLT